MDDQRPTTAVAAGRALDRLALKPYEAPRLVVYGSIREITRQLFAARNKDGGNNGINSRT